MHCELCGKDAPLRDAEFGMNIGLLVARYHSVTQGRMCPGCIHATFWSCTPVTLVLGWWGVISFFVTPIVLAVNIITYATVFFGKPYSEPLAAPLLTREAEANLEGARQEIVSRLLRGETLEMISHDLGPRLGLSPQDVRAFYTAR